MPAPAPIASAESTLDISTMPGFDEKEKPDPSVGINALDALFVESGGNPKAPEEPLVVKADDAPPAKKESIQGKEITREEALKDLGDPATWEAEKAALLAEQKEKPPVAKETPPAPVVKETVTTEKDEFDAVELPTNAKPKTGESFNQLKSLARERVAAVSKERDTLKTEVETLRAKTAEGLPKEIQDELKTLREFRSKMDVEADPAFSSFDRTIAENTESIYAKLKATPGIDEKQLEAIKSLGGPSEVDWDGPGIKLPSQLRRFIDAKLVENETLAEKKTKAVTDAKTNADQYLTTRREQQTKGVEQQNKAVETEIETMLPKFPWFKELKAKDGASAEDKTAIDNHNKLVVEATAVLKDSVTDNSPAMRAVLAVGYAQLLKTRADFSAFKVSAAAKEKQLTTDLEAANTLLAKIKKSSTTRLRDTPAEDDGKPSKASDISTPGTDALDKILKDIQSAKE